MLAPPDADRDGHFSRRCRKGEGLDEAYRLRRRVCDVELFVLVRRLHCVYALTPLRIADSSTIGRISKPFNPLISETFEYVEPRKQYRYISEQVSHHPPISACIGQSPSWEYFGMVDAKSKFMGKSFEIRPTGTAHVTLRIPEEWADPSCPPCKTAPGLREEHYSWLKVGSTLAPATFFKRSQFDSATRSRLPSRTSSSATRSSTTTATWSSRTTEQARRAL